MAFDSLVEEVESLVASRHEGEYWDFKREWPRNDSLLHDILCMSNNLAFRDGLIIIGIDEEKGFAPSDVTDDPNRKNSQNIIDFLGGKPFAGGMRPVVSVETIAIDGCCVDVVIVHASRNAPYYFDKPVRLSDSGMNFTAGSIYTRVGDTNTPIDKTADRYITEKLWEHHFCYDGSPLERFMVYVSDRTKWVDSPGSYEGIREYYKDFPEFTIEHVSDDRLNGQEYYNFLMMDNSPAWYDIYLRYYDTVIAHFQGTALDGGRYFTPVPERSFIHTASHDPISGLAYVYCYFIMNDFLHRLHGYFYRGENGDETIAHDQFMCGVVLYESEEEREVIEAAIQADVDDFEKRVAAVETYAYIPDEVIDRARSYYEESFGVVRVIQDMLEEIRKSPYLDKLQTKDDKGIPERW